MTTPVAPQSRSYKRLPRTQLMFIIYVAIFGVIWGIGTSVLAVALPPDPITRVILIGWFEAAILILLKIVIRHPFSATFTIAIAASISIFTFSFGPPNPYKPLFIIAGLAFDAGTFFRTKQLRVWNLIVGIVSYILVAGIVFVAIFYLLDPAVVPAVIAAFPIAALLFVFFGVVLAILFGRLLLESPPQRLREVWRQMGLDLVPASTDLKR